MAYDEGLAERIRSVLQDEGAITEKKMFGGIAFLLKGHMFVGTAKGDLMVRVGPERHAECLKQPHARPMDFTGKPMVGYVFVSPDGLSEDEVLERWVRLGLRFAGTLPEKTKTPKKKAAKAKQPKRSLRRK
jgi:TfoX/Sxy family transcriptional regulator of competence genes